MLADRYGMDTEGVLHTTTMADADTDRAVKGQ